MNGKKAWLGSTYVLTFSFDVSYMLTNWKPEPSEEEGGGNKR
jgi:hypothetical protein